jgi:hypothetical protein
MRRPRSKSTRARALGIAVALQLAACSGPPSSCPNAPSSCPSSVPSFQRDIHSIIVADCLPCHNPPGASQPPALNSYQAVSTSASQSLDQIAGCLMPPRDGGLFVLSEQDRQTLLTWYVCGAPNN